MQTIKSFKLLIIALVVSINMFSQTNVYKPFPQTNGIWEIRHWGPFGPGLPGNTTHFRYTVQGDTTIGAFSYKKVVSASSPIQTGPTYSFGPDSFSFSYRNDIATKKVYRNLGINHDTLWYDFNLNVGDTIKNCYSNNSYFEKIVQSIDSVLICGIYNKRFVYCSSYSEGNLIEGVGFSSNFINGFTSECPPFEPVELDYTTFSTCIINSAAEYLKEEQIKLFPNPTSSELKITFSLDVSTYSIINSIGEIVLKGTDLSTINVSSLANGMYLIKMQDKSGKSYQSKFIKQ